MLRGNLHAYMDMIRHQVAFNDPAFLLTCQLMEDGPQGFTNVAIHGLPAPLGDKHDVVLAIPPRMRQALIGVRHGVLLRCALIRPPEEYSTPGSLKALPVSLVKPVAYLKDRVMQGTAEFHHEIADAVLPQPDPVFDDAAALDAAVHMLDPSPTVVQSLIGQFLLPRQLLATGFLGWHQDLHLGQRKRQALLLDSRVLCDQ